MKICHITSVHPATDTRIYIKMVLGLHQAGVESILVAPNELSQEEQPNTILLAPPSGRLERLCSFRRKVALAALNTKPDIVHLHDPEMFTYVRFFQKRGIKVVLDWHEHFVSQIRTKHWIPRTLRRPISVIANYWCKRVCKQSDATITVTPQIATYMSFTNPALIRNYPTLREFPECIPEYNNRKNLVYVGMLSPQRGSREMAQAVSNIAHRSPITLTVAGPLDVEENADEMNRLAEPAVIDFQGLVNRDQVGEVLTSAKIGLCLFKDIGNHQVAYPTKIFEYMMWGIPVVMSHLDSLVDLFDDEVPGIFVDPNNVDEITNAIQWLLDNPKEAEKMGLVGQKLINEKFNWEHDFASLIDLYENIM